MLNNVTQAADAAAPVSEDKYKVGDYAVYPRLGLSVISARKTMEVGGLDFATLEVRPLHDLKTSVSIPEMKIRTSGLRRPAAASQFKEALFLVAGKAKGEGQKWHSRAQKYEERLKTADLFEIASIIRDIVGKHRHKKFANVQTEDVPPDAAVSYSERILVLEALNLLSREMAFVTGLSIGEASRLFMAAALDPSLNINEKRFVDRGEVSMPGRKFEEIFGRGVREASKAKDNLISVNVPSAPLAPVRRTVSPVDMAIADKPRQSRVNVTSRARLSVTGSNLDEVKPELRELYAQYQPQCALSGYKGAAFKLATQYCSVADFDLLCQMVFLKNDVKPSPETIAAKMEIGVDDMWKQAEEAFDRLKRRGSATGSKAFFHVKFPARPRTAESKKAAEPVVSEANRATYDLYKEKIGFGLKQPAFRLAAGFLPADDFKLLVRGYLIGRSHFQGLGALADERNETVEAVHSKLEKILRTLKEEAAQRKIRNILTLEIPGLKAPSVAKPLFDTEDFANKLKEDVRTVYKAEDPFTVPGGMTKSLFRKAAQSLPADQFEILSKTEFRLTKKRMTIEAYAAEKEMTVEATIALRNQASAALNATEKFKGQHPALRDYLAEEAKPPRFEVREELKDIFEAESKFLPQKGFARTFVIKATEVLNAEEFEVLSKTDMRLNVNIVPLDVLAAEKGLSRDEMRTIRDAASAKLRRAFNGAAPRILNYKVLNGYVTPVEKTPRVDLPPVDMKMAGEIIDGKFRIILEMPLSSLKGADTFRVEGTIAKQADIPVSIKAAGKVGKGRGGYFKATGAVNAPPKLEK